MREGAWKGVLPLLVTAAAMVVCAQGQRPGTAASTAAQPAVSPAGPLTKLTNEQMRHFGRMRTPRLSPDGKHVLLEVWETTAAGGRSHLWLIDTGGGAPRQLTFSPEGDKRGERAGEWLPDGESVLFLAHRGEHTSLFRLPMGGGEAKRLDLKVVPQADESQRPDAVPPPPADKSKVAPAEAKPEPIAIDVEGYRIAPDGSSVAVWARDPETPGEKREKDAKADAQWVDHDTHGSRLYLLSLHGAVDAGQGDGDAPKGDTLLPVAVPPDVRHVAWSPDGKRLLVLAEGPNDAGDLQPAMSAWTVEASDPAHPSPVRDLPPTTSTATWSADGTSLFYLAQAKADAPPGVMDLYRYAIASRQSADLSDGFAGSLGGDLTALRDGSVLLQAEAGLDGVAVRYTPGRREPELVRLPVAVVRDAQTNAAENGWVFLGDGGAAPLALYLSQTLATRPATLKTPPMLPEGVTPGPAPKRVHWRNERFDLDGLLYLPAEASATHTVPLVVEVHGGPAGAYLDSFDPFAHFLLAQGWAVLRTNPRGSTGRGASFAAANKNDLGGGDFRDVMSGVDQVLKTEPALDARRMALMGYSYGGEMAGFAEGKTTRFRAIVSMAPVIDQQSEYGTEQGSWYDRWYFGKPWEHEADAWRQSALSGVREAKTPFLLIQGESDTTDPLGQSQEMYRALRQAGVPVEMVTYPREDHGPLAIGIYGAPSTEPWHGFDARQRIVAFVAKAFAEGK